MDDQIKDAAIELQNLATRLLRSARSAHAQQGLGSAQYSALAVLYDRGPLSVVELAQAERVAHPTMSRIVAGLSKRGAVTRAPNPHDRRSRMVDLTTEGRRLYENVSRKRIALTEAILAQLKTETVGELLAAVRRVAAAFEQSANPD